MWRNDSWRNDSWRNDSRRWSCCAWGQGASPPGWSSHQVAVSVASQVAESAAGQVVVSAAGQVAASAAGASGEGEAWQHVVAGKAVKPPERSSKPWEQGWGFSLGGELCMHGTAKMLRFGCGKAKLAE